jgi:hypothetical protein
MDQGCNLNHDCAGAGLHYQAPEKYNACTIPQQAPEPVDGCKYLSLPKKILFLPKSGRLTVSFSQNRAPGSPSWRLHRQGISEPTLYHSLLTRFSSHRNLLLPAYLFKVLVISLPRGLFFLREHKGRKKGGKEGEVDWGGREDTARGKGANPDLFNFDENRKSTKRESLFFFLSFFSTSLSRFSSLFCLICFFFLSFVEKPN